MSKAKVTKVKGSMLVTFAELWGQYIYFGINKEISILSPDSKRTGRALSLLAPGVVSE